MVKTPSGATPAPRLLRAARRELLDTGRLSVEVLDEGLSRSWLRSRDFGLSPVGRPQGAPHASGAQLRRALERQHELVAHARPVMEDLFEQTRDSDGLVILADAQGLLLGALGDGRFVDRAQRVALRPGAIWDERWRGTNAIGTALAEQRPVSVLGGEHFLERNGFLSCTAAPIRDPPDHDPAQWPRDEADAEGRQAEQQLAVAAARKQRRADLRREEGIDQKIVEFEAIAGDHRGDLPLAQSLCRC